MKSVKGSEKQNGNINMGSQIESGGFKRKWRFCCKLDQ